MHLVLWAFFLLISLFPPVTADVVLSKQAIQKLPHFWKLPAFNPRFVGRKSLLEAISQHFAQADVPLLVLTGPPGVGKTQLAKQYAHTSFHVYAILWWWEANTAFEPQLWAFVEELNALLDEKERLIPQSMASEKLWVAVQKVLLQKGYTCLFIFDNAEEETRVSSYLASLNLQKTIHILLTSSSKATSFPTLPVTPFTRDESLAFLSSTLPDTPLEERIHLADASLDYPLALTLAAGWIRFTPGASVQRWENRHASAPQLPVFTDQYPHNVSTMVDLTLRSLQTTAPDAVEVLQFLSLLHASQIPLSWVLAWCKGDQEKTDKCLRALHKWSLIDCHTTDDKNTTLSIHPLLHQVLYTSLSHTEKTESLTRAIPIVANALKGSASEMAMHLLRGPHLFSHAQRLSACAQEEHYNSLPLLSLRIRILHYLHSGLRDFEQAQKLLTLIEADPKLLSQLPFEEKILYETETSFLAAATAMENEKALHHGKRALLLLKKIPERQAEKVRVMANMLQIYTFNGHKEEAELLFKALTPLCTACTDPMRRMGSVQAEYLSTFGQFETALSLLEEHVPLLQDLTHHPSSRISFLRIKTSILVRLNQLEVCRNTLNSLEKEIQHFYGTREPPVLATFLVLRVWCDLKSQRKFSLERALSDIQKALTIYTTAWKGECKNPLQGFTHFVKGQIYAHHSHYPEALQAYQEAGKIYDALLHTQAIEDRSLLYSAVIWLAKRLSQPDLAQYYLSKHVQAFRLYHPRTKQLLQEAGVHLEKKP